MCIMQVEFPNSVLAKEYEYTNLFVLYTLQQKNGKLDFLSGSVNGYRNLSLRIAPLPNKLWSADQVSG